VSNRPQYSIVWRVIETDVVPACVEEGIGQIVWSPTAEAFFGDGDFTGESGPAGIDLEPALIAAVTKSRALVADAGLSPSQFAVAWTLQQPGISSAVLSPRSPEDVERYVSAVDVDLDPDLVHSVQQLLDPWTVSDPARSGLKTSP
jgi:aryl-alcohol dehydrogenase-like predicted oxidoreductase